MVQATESDPDLARVVAAWTTLAEADRASILAIVERGIATAT